MRLIDADELKEVIYRSSVDTREKIKNIIDNAPTVCNDNYSMGYQDGVKKVLSERPQGEIIKELWNCRDELCLRCGKYHDAWKGACNDCRYNFENMKKWKGEQE